MKRPYLLLLVVRRSVPSSERVRKRGVRNVLRNFLVHRHPPAIWTDGAGHYAWPAHPQGTILRALDKASYCEVPV